MEGFEYSKDKINDNKNPSKFKSTSKDKENTQNKKR